MEQSQETTQLDRNEVADLLGVKPNTVSNAAHNKFICQGYFVYDWAVWHPKGNMILHYEVPNDIIEEHSDQTDTPSKS